MKFTTRGRLALLCAALILSACAPNVKVVAERYEKNRQTEWCATMAGQLDVKLDDGTYVDCITDVYAVEVDLAEEWAEAIGWALYYAARTGKKPAVVLVMAKPEDQLYLSKLQTVATLLEIKVWTVEAPAAK